MKRSYTPTVPNPAPPPPPNPPTPQTGVKPGGGPVPSIPCASTPETLQQVYERTTPPSVQADNAAHLERAVKHHGGPR